MNLSEINKEISENSKLVIKFGATWCRPCIKIEPILKELQEENPSIKFLLLECDTTPEILEHFGIRSIPYIHVYKEGILVDQLVGLKSKKEIQNAIL